MFLNSAACCERVDKRDKVVAIDDPVGQEPVGSAAGDVGERVDGYFTGAQAVDERDEVGAVDDSIRDLARETAGNAGLQVEKGRIRYLCL